LQIVCSAADLLFSLRREDKPLDFGHLPEWHSKSVQAWDSTPDSAQDAGAAAPAEFISDSRGL
jgi:hypothetical protein